MAEKRQSYQHHEGKQPFLERRFNADLTNIEAEVAVWIEQSDSNMIEAQEEHVKELRKLIERKASIEREILSITLELRAAYNKSKDILKVILDGRADDYDEALKQLDELKAGKSSTNAEVSQEL